MFFLREFSNGIRFVHKERDSDIAHFSVVLNIGSRDENDYNKGISHFLEHMFFKGTQRRKSYHILSFLDNVGGDLNAYTTKEKIVIHASFLKNDFKRAVDLICDIIFNSVFPEKEIEKEKTVIIDEINSYKDSPSEMIMDEIEEIVFKNKYLGNNILGSPDSVCSIKREDINRFLIENLSTEEVVFSSIGNISKKELEYVCDKYFKNKVYNSRNNNRKQSIIGLKKNIEKELDTNQSHIVLAMPSFGFKDERVITTQLINTYLAGSSMSSVLNLKLREKYGIAYNIESFYSSYSDNGIFGIYLGTDRKNINKSIKIILKEIKKLRENFLGENIISKIKRQFIGQIGFLQENSLGHCIFLGKSLLNYGLIEEWKDTLKKIEKIDSKNILETSNYFLKEEDISTLIYK